MQGPTTLNIETTFNEDLFGEGRERLFVSYLTSHHILEAAKFNGTFYELHEDIDTNSAEYKAAQNVGYVGSGSVLLAILTSVGLSILL